MLYDVIETPIGPIKVEWTAAVLGEQLGVVAAAHTGHAVLLHNQVEKMRFLGAVDLVAVLAGTAIPKERLEVLELASSTFQGYLNPTAGGAASCEAQGRELLGLSGVTEGELEAVSAEDAMAHTGRVLGFEYGAASCEAQGRELLGLSGVPEGELEAVSAEDAKAHKGRVLGFEHGAEGGSANLGKTFNMKKETAEKLGRFWWSSQHIESFNAAVEDLGGLQAAKGTAILQKLLAAKSMSALMLRVVNKRLWNARITAKKRA